MALINNVFSKAKTLAQKSRGFLSVSGGKYADTLLGGLLWLFLAKFLPQAAYGSVIYWYSLALMLAFITSLGFQTSIKTYLPKGEEEIKREGNLLSFFPTLISTLILVMLAPSHLYGAALYLFFRSRYFLSIAEILGKQRYKEYLCVAIGKRILQIIASIGLYQLMGINGILIGLSIGLAASSYRSLKHLLSFLPFTFSVTKAHSSYIWYNFARATIVGITLSLDRLLIGFFYGNKLLGAYGFISQIASFLILLPRGFGNYLLPEKAAGKGAKLAEVVGTVGSAILSGLAFAFTPWGVTWLFDKFTSAIPAIRLISFIPIFAMVSIILTTTFLSQEKGQTPFLTKILSRSVRIGGVLLFYKFFSIIGVGVALLLEQLSRIFFLWAKRKSDK